MKAAAIGLALSLISGAALACDGDRYPCPVQSVKTVTYYRMASRPREKPVREVVRDVTHEPAPPPVKPIRAPRKPVFEEIMGMTITDWPVKPYRVASLVPSPSSTLPPQNVEIVYLEPPPAVKSDREDRPMWSVIHTEPGFALTLFVIWIVALTIAARAVHRFWKPQAFATNTKGSFYDRISDATAYLRTYTPSRRAGERQSEDLFNLRVQRFYSKLGDIGREKLRDPTGLRPPVVPAANYREPASPLGSLASKLRTEPASEWWNEAGLSNSESYRQPLGG